jgi:hypothetical protein
VNWAKINEEGATTSGTPKAFQEQAYILRNYIDTDKCLVQDINQIADPRGSQAPPTCESVAYDFNDKFINNNHASRRLRSHRRHPRASTTARPTGSAPRTRSTRARR